ncbi:hypothetical protein CSC43_3629 [Pseudomonas aeruginosa]|nr:hypothetical protein CSC43_3629 [Pseudomonas aeruginosa]
MHTATASHWNGRIGSSSRARRKSRFMGGPPRADRKEATAGGSEARECRNPSSGRPFFLLL